jgi:ABC-type sugar transport system ATPase subunit
MLGREIESQFPPVEASSGKKVLLELRDFSDFSGKLTNVDLRVYEGEVVGLYGLVGAGRTELAQTIFGINKRRAGRLFFDQTEIEQVKNPREMIKRGMLLVPEDRKQNGLFLKGFRLKENLTIGLLRDELVGALGLISMRKELRCVERMSSSDAIRLKFSSHNQDVEELSGGNQQKTLIARWIFKKNMKFLIMDEPTQGIDVGVKYDIYVLIRRLAQENIGVLLISSELPELIGVCDRLYVLKDGKIKAEVKRADFDTHGVMEMVI